MKATPLSLLTLALLMTASCSSGPGSSGPTTTSEILVTSEAGARMETVPNVEFVEGVASGGTIITVWPDSTKQTIHGIGSSFTESSAFVLAHLEPAKRAEVMRKIYGADGANFSLTRTHIASCDFSVEGKYSYAEQEGDAELTSFTITPDTEGFDPAVYPGVKDPLYDLLPMIHEALAIKTEQGDDLKIIASAWTAPPWMKDLEDWYVPGTAENDWQGTGGSLKPEYEATYADYLVKYLDAYKAEDVDMWGLTPVNEPHGNGGHWESMNFSAESQNAFIQNHLGPKLKAGAHADTRLLIFDQNRDGVDHWADVIFADPAAKPFVFGMAVHWYASTFKVYEDAFERVHAQYPGFEIIHTEGCIDALGGTPPGGVADPAGYQEEPNWFMNDAWWWNSNATDWAYTVDWGFVDADDHPMYTPVHRYARNIIVSLDHWMTGWVDWNIVLDSNGGPNHVDNFCGAPIMIDTETGEIHYTPVYHVLAQFSRTIRPGDKAVWTRLESEGLGEDALHACATVNGEGFVSVQVLNTTKEAVELQLQVEKRVAAVMIPANAVQTIRYEP